MEIFLAILILVVASLLAGGQTMFRLRRARPVVVLLTGGWVALAGGIALGESGLGLFADEAILKPTPLLMMGLGWIGTMVGLQLRRDVLLALPPSLKRLVLTDVLASGAIFACLAAGGGWLWLRSEADGPVDIAALWRIVALLAAGAIGWSMETRSLRPRQPGPADERLALAIRAGGGLCAATAIVIFGVSATLVVRMNDGALSFAPGGAALDVGLTMLLALVAGLLGRYGLRLAGRHRDQQLVVFLGLVVFVAGVAVQLEVTPLFAALLTGAVVANLQGSDLRNFERFILGAEHTVAALFALLAGVLLDPRIGIGGLLFAVAIAAVRIATKPALLRSVLGRAAPGPGDRVAGELPRRSPLLAGPIRQIPLHLAMAVSLVLAEPSVLHKRLLAVVALAGLLSELLPLLTSTGRLLLPAAQGPTDADGEAEGLPA